MASEDEHEEIAINRDDDIIFDKDNDITFTAGNYNGVDSFEKEIEQLEVRISLTNLSFGYLLVITRYLILTLYTQTLFK